VRERRRGDFQPFNGAEYGNRGRDVWVRSNTDNGHYLRVYMGHLRQKLEDNPTQPAYLLTETAVGYRLFVPQS
jgi:DNA-binding response OmpR family regulator